MIFGAYRDDLIESLLRDFSERFSTCVPHTTRPRRTRAKMNSSKLEVSRSSESNSETPSNQNGTSVSTSSGVATQTGTHCVGTGKDSSPTFPEPNADSSSVNTMSSNNVKTHAKLQISLSNRSNMFADTSKASDGSVHGPIRSLSNRVPLSEVNSNLNSSRPPILDVSLSINVGATNRERKVDSLKGGSCSFEEEIDGRDYHFIEDKAQMQRMIKEGAFIEAGLYNGHIYGTSFEIVRSIMNKVCDFACY